MNIQAHGITMFCDDIRHEIGGKMTLVGCYSSEMTFTNPAPGILPSFGALVNIRIPNNVRFRSFTLKFIRDYNGGSDELLSLDAEVPEKVFEEDQPSLTHSTADDSDKIFSLSIPVQWHSLAIDSPGIIKVRLKLDTGQEIKAGSLKINFPQGN